MVTRNKKKIHFSMFLVSERWLVLSELLVVCVGLGVVATNAAAWVSSLYKFYYNFCLKKALWFTIFCTKNCLVAIQPILDFNIINNNLR